MVVVVGVEVLDKRIGKKVGKVLMVFGLRVLGMIWLEFVREGNN